MRSVSSSAEKRTSLEIVRTSAATALGSKPLFNFTFSSRRAFKNFAGSACASW